LISTFSIIDISEHSSGLVDAAVTSGTKDGTRAAFDLAIECENNTHVTNGGDPTGYFITITNTGTEADTIEMSFKIIEVTGGEEADVNDWNAAFDKDTINLAPSASEVVVMTVMSLCTCQEGYTATIRATAQSVNAPSVSKYVDTFTIYGPPAAGTVELVLDDLLQFEDLVAGKPFDFSIYVYNFQNVPQTYELTNPNLYSGWIVEFDGGAFEVLEKDNKTVDIVLKTPLTNEPGWYNLSFNIQSTKDTIIKNSLSVPIHLQPELTVESITPSILSPEVGETIEFDIVVANLGTALAKNINVHILNESLINSPEYLIQKTSIKELNAHSNTTIKYNWKPKEPKRYNFTVFVNPNFPIKEMSNRYYNNFKTRVISIHEIPSGNGQNNDGSDSNENGSASNIFNSPYFIPSVVAGIVILLVLILVLLKSRSGDKAKSDDEKTAKKIPLRSGFSSGSKLSYKRKTARKEKLSRKEQHKLAAERHSGRRHGRRRRRHR
jgi:hypothetical protein